MYASLNLLDPELIERARPIRLLILDVDGVLTDGQLYYGEDGEHFRAFHVRDGLGIKWLTTHEIGVAVISGRRSAALPARLEPLGVQPIYQGQEDKTGAFQEVMDAHGVTTRETAYMGDDVQDLPVMARAGFAATVRDAHPLVLERAHWRSGASGGHGAVRELSELLLHSQGKLAPLLRASYLGTEAP